MTGNDQDGYQLATNHYTPGLGWAGVELMGDIVDQPDIAMGRDGGAILTWTSPGYALAAEYERGVGWGKAFELHECGIDPCASGNARVAIDVEGRGMAMWSSVDGTDRTIWGRRYLPDSGWEAAELIATSPLTTTSGYPSTGLDVAIDPNGNAVAAWAFGVDAGATIWASFYSTAEGWREPEPVATGVQDSRSIQLAVDALGSAFVAWNEERALWVNRYDVAEGWGQPLEIAERFIFTLYTSVLAGLGVDDAGNATLLWQAEEGQIVTSRFAPGAGWGPVEEVGVGLPPAADFTGEQPAHPHLAMAPDGSAVAVWEQEDWEVPSIVARRYSPEQGWQPVQVIEQYHSSPTVTPHVAINEKGAAIAVWLRYGSNHGDNGGIWANASLP